MCFACFSSSVNVLLGLQIYDASCIAKEYGYNRELRQFMQITISTDRLHEVNHKSCSNFLRPQNTFNQKNINSEACEQTNLALRRITSSTSFMSPSMYMRSLTLFMADINITANKFKEKYFQSQSWKNDRKYCTILFNTVQYLS